MIAARSAPRAITGPDAAAFSGANMVEEVSAKTSMRRIVRRFIVLNKPLQKRFNVNLAGTVTVQPVEGEKIFHKNVGHSFHFGDGKFASCTN